ncbi:hypothetical protein ACQ29_gp550 [Escherichia phage PBECO4]|uniref:Uncharacterized protein n=1 Tax=Escherichia phage PBECO4 TaxID=1273738 RepID=L7TQH3_9CAUD|nr:hypothetical protein ACQ29_gp550 [Escherichia phage PBECO4]AGC35230.1 hypothetical protein [Escherichia phage PBECO4]
MLRSITPAVSVPDTAKLPVIAVFLVMDTFSAAEVIEPTVSTPPTVALLVTFRAVPIPDSVADPPVIAPEIEAVAAETSPETTAFVAFRADTVTSVL